MYPVMLQGKVDMRRTRQEIPGVFLDDDGKSHAVTVTLQKRDHDSFSKDTFLYITPAVKP